MFFILKKEIFFFPFSFENKKTKLENENSYQACPQSFYLLFLSPCFLFSILSYFLLFLPSPFYCSWIPPFIPSVNVGFTPFVPQPFLASCGHLSRTAHSLAGCPAITSTQSVLVAPLSISKQNYLSCFLHLSVFVSPQWIRIKLPHHLPLWHESCGHNPHLPLLGEMPSQQDIFPKKFEREPQNKPHFLPTAKPHPLNTLTHSLPPMYQLGTSRWCPSPLCTFHFVCVCSFLAFTPFLLLLCYLVLLYILACVYPLWHERYVGFWAHVFFLLSHPRLGIVPAKAHALFFMVMGLLAINLVILLHCVCHDLVLPLLLITPMGLLAGVPTILAHWPINSLQWASLVHLLHLYLLSFLWAYQPSFLPRQPIEFTTLFLGLPRPIYFFISFYSHGIIV